jgi:hypothetical protein
VLARFFLLIILFIVIARNFWRFVDGLMSGVTGGPPRGGQKSGPPVSVKMTQCPICGTYVVPGKAISLISAGTPLYFDTEKCRAEYQSR